MKAASDSNLSKRVTQYLIKHIAVFFKKKVPNLSNRLDDCNPDQFLSQSNLQTSDMLWGILRDCRRMPQGYC
jgi:hypothetical protein